MSPKAKKVLSALFITLSVAAVFIIAFSNPEMHNAWDAIRSLDLLWLAGLFGCWVAYVFFDSLGSFLCLRHQGFPLGMPTVVRIVLIGFYYSNITPGASGGQPMQVSSMRRCGVPVGNGTTVVTVRLIFNQFMVSLISLVLLILNRGFVHEQLAGAIWFVRVGWLINFSVVPLVLLAAFRRELVRKLASWVIRLLSRIRVIRNRESAEERAARVLDTYHTAVSNILRSPLRILQQCLCSGLSLLGLTGSIVFVYHAFGMSGTHWYHLLTLSFLLFVSASYTPLPGASGAQEGGFLYYFRDIFTGGTIGLALLVWRFFTYYLFLFVGVFMLLADKIALRRKTGHEDRMEGS